MCMWKHGGKIEKQDSVKRKKKKAKEKVKLKAKCLTLKGTCRH